MAQPSPKLSLGPLSLALLLLFPLCVSSTLKNDALFNAFEKVSADSLRHFKREFDKSFEHQSQLFRFDSKDNARDSNDDFVFRINFPGYQIDNFANQHLINYPMPNIRGSNRYTQLLVSLDYSNYLHVWQFTNHSHIALFEQPFRVNIDQYKASKILSFVQNPHIKQASFRLFVLILFKKEQYSRQTTDKLAIYTFDGEWNEKRGEGNSLKPSSYRNDHLDDSQKFEVHNILDFDVIHDSTKRDAHRNVYYLSTITMSANANSKYDLNMYRLDEKRENKEFNKMATVSSDDVLNCKLVKMAYIDSALHLICAHSRQAFSSYEKARAITLYRYDNIRSNSGSINVVTSLNNDSLVDKVIDIHSWPKSHFLIFTLEHSVEVYKFYPPGTIEWRDSLISSQPLRAIGLAKIPAMAGLLPSMMVSTDGARLITYRNMDSDFYYRILQLEKGQPPPGYEISKLVVFNWANQYYIWAMFEFAGNPPKSVGRIYKANLETPKSSEDIRTLDHCIFDLYSRIENGIKLSKAMERRSEEMIFIEPSKPLVLFNVTVLDTFTIANVPKRIIMNLPEPHRILHASEVVDSVHSVQDRLQQLQNTMYQNVVMRSINQTILSRVHFHKPLKVGRLTINRVTDNLFVNNVAFEEYSNNTLTVQGDQTLESRTGGLNFKAGLQVDELNVDKVNGVSVKEALLVNGINVPQMITGEHTFRTLVELRNGMTAPSINNIKLHDLFQDIPQPSQLLNHHIWFKTLNIPQLAIDTTLNDVNLKKWESEIVWLDNQAIRLQEFSGRDLEFVGGIKANQIDVEGMINNKLDLDRFITKAARTDQEFTLKGPVVFNVFAHARKDVYFRGLLNGAIDLLRGVILLHSEQDFSQFSQAPLIFDSTVSVANLSMNLLNGQIRSRDFVLKSELIKVSTPTFPMLRNKMFVNNFFVKKNVDLNDRVRINSLDLSELYQLMDTVASFNTELEVEQLEVGGNMAALAYNNYEFARVHKIMTTRLSKTMSQNIQAPITYLKGAIKVQNLIFNRTSNGLVFPRDFVKRNALDLEVSFYGPKFFTSSVSANDIWLGPPNGTVNGHRISKLYEAMVKNDTTKGASEAIGGQKQFARMIVLGDLFVEDGLLNECFLDKAVLVNSNQQVLNKLILDIVSVEMEQVHVKDLAIRQLLAGYNFSSLLSDLVLYSPNRPIHLFNKHFPKGLSLTELHLDVSTKTSTVGSIDLANIVLTAITLEGTQAISSSLHFADAVFEYINSFTLIQNFNRTYFENVILKSSKLISIDGTKVFHRDLVVNHLDSTGQLINGIFNLTHITLNTLMRYGDQIVTKKHIFLKPIKFLSVRINPTVKLSDRLFSDIVQLNQHITFNNDVIFEHLIEVQNLHVTGFVDHCNLIYVAQHSIKRNPDFTFNLSATYTMPHLTVRRNLRVQHLINGQANFISHIATRVDGRPFYVDLAFSTDVFVDHLLVNSLINKKYNLTHLLKDAVYVHLPQVITGRKVFEKPLRIYGFVRQEPGKQVHIDRQMNLVNVNQLFKTTVMADRTRPISGNKQFFGRIRVVGPIKLALGLNGAPVPQGYHLTHTNESITGETYFTKRVHVNQNLNARLINRINLTQFVSNLVYVHPIESIPRSDMPMDTISVVTFEDGIYIKNLTIRKKINDIPVGDLLHRDSSDTQVSGFKKFLKPIRILGNLQLGTVSSVDFERDLKREWIDTRHSAESVPVNVTGSLIIKAPTEMEHLNFADRLNDFTIGQFNPKYFANLKQVVHRLNNTLGTQMRDLTRIERNLGEHVKVDYLNELRYFNMIQNFVEPILEFFPLTYGQPTRTDNLFIVRRKYSYNLTHDCAAYQSQYYEVDHLKTTSIFSQIRNITPDMYRVGTERLVASFNMKTTVVHSVSLDGSAAAVIYSKLGSSSTCWRRHQGLAHSDLIIIHIVKLFNGTYLPDDQGHVLRLPLLTQGAALIKRAKMFSISGSTTKVLVLLFEDAFTQRSSGLEVFRLESKVYHVQSFKGTILDFDLVEIPGDSKHPSQILLSVVNDFQSSLHMYQPEASHSSIFMWHPSHQQFKQSTNPFNVPYFSKFYAGTKFVKTRALGIFVLYSTVYIGSDGDLCTASKPGNIQRESFENFIDVWRFSSSGFYHYQRISLGSSNDDFTSGAMESVEIGRQVYLLVVSGRDMVSMFQWQGFSRFVSLARYRVEGVTSLSVFWNAHTLYLAIGSQLPGKSQLLAAVLSTNSEEQQLFKSNNWITTINEMREYTRNQRFGN